MKASILSCPLRAGAGVSGRNGRECARTRSAPQAAKATSTSESDHLAANDNPHLSSRRAAAALLLAGGGGAAALSLLLLGPRPADAAAPAAAAAPTLSSAGKRGLAAYVRKRKLDPLSSYVPAVLAAREQLAGLEGLVASDPVEARIELRSGAFEGLRDNVRAVGEYAAESGSSSSSNSGSRNSSSSESVKSFFESVQKLDYELFAAAREKRDPSSATAEALRAGVAALDALLATVPAADLEEARRLVATAAKIEKETEASSSSTAAAAAGTAAIADDEKLRMIVPGAAR